MLLAFFRLFPYFFWFIGSMRSMLEIDERIKTCVLPFFWFNFHLFPFKKCLELLLFIFMALKRELRNVLCACLREGKDAHGRVASDWLEIEIGSKMEKRNLINWKVFLEENRTTRAKCKASAHSDVRQGRIPQSISWNFNKFPNLCWLCSSETFPIQIEF